MMKRIWAFINRYNSIIFFSTLLIILLVPAVRMPVQVFVQRLISTSPSPVEEEKRTQVDHYDWQLSDSVHHSVSFSRSKNRVVVINFWATWCPPCVAEMPYFQSLYDEFGDNVDFYFISDESITKQLSFLSKKELWLPIYQSITQPPKAFQSSSLPTSILMNKKGELVIFKVGAADWSSKKTRSLIKELLAE